MDRNKQEEHAGFTTNCAPDVKPLKGFGGAGVLEVIEDYRGATYRAVYTVRFAGTVYVLHVLGSLENSDYKAR
jgi:phage-related protein